MSDYSATAFWLEAGKVKYTFNNALITANPDSNIDGWSLAWTSHEKCGDGNFKFSLDAVCDDTKDSEGSFTWLMGNI
jgi:hypothetical protein